MRTGNVRHAGRAFGADAVSMLVLFAAALVVRLIYATAMGTPPFDPWRHLLLIDACRAGSGFTLFAGQPYLWYQPLWHPVAALLPRAIGPALLAAAFGALQVALWYPLARTLSSSERLPALTSAACLVAFGPLVRYTVHVGPEAFALCLVTIGLLLLSRRSGLAGAACGGVVFGLGTLARLNLGPLALLALPLARVRSRAAVFAAGVALPLALGWWRNRSIVDRYDWLFTWDGLAVRAAGFDAASLLMPQRHPAIAAALARLHERIVPVPEWIRDADGVRWETIFFLLLGVAALALARHTALTASAAVLFGYLLLLDETGSSNFFRLYLPLFPLLLTAGAIAALRSPRHARRWSAAVLGLTLLLGARSLVPPAAPPLEQLVPRPGTIEPGRTYAVTSGLFHPEALAYADPESSYVGLPLLPDDLELFLAAHPQIDAVVLHDFTVQPELVRTIERLYGPPSHVSTNPGGYSHRVFELAPR